MYKGTYHHYHMIELYCHVTLFSVVTDSGNISGDSSRACKLIKRIYIHVCMMSSQGFIQGGGRPGISPPQLEFPPPKI